MLRNLRAGCHLVRLTASVYNKQPIMADVVVDKSFPIEYLVPKNETGVVGFLKKYPEYNGDGVTIAILDSGVDPKATGLERTPDGSVKVIERFDCSGCGDVDISKKVTPAADGTITGLSGRKIKISEAIKKEIVGNEYNIGIKSLHDLYPSKVNDKINNDCKQKCWDEKQKKAVAEISRQIAEFDAANLSNSSNLPLKDKLKKEELDNTLEFLQSFEKQFSDAKLSYDCIVYPTKNGWKCAIDVVNGDLEKAIVLGEYSKTHDIKSIDEYLSVSINVHDNGNVLEIVGICSSHGTHVASIAAGNHAQCGTCEMDGVAPGAKIVSLTIGDGRLGSMETGTAIIRAIVKIMELCNAGNRVHLINMSYGEFSHWSHTGRVGEMMNEIVNDYGVIWMASAGNHGPALCTIGTPPDISQPSCIGVGAYVSPEMMVAEYAAPDKLPANVYTWTSRDPCIDGGQGVTICAPGAAITSVPEFTLNKQQLMNGTSMSAPHACGVVALLLSGLLKQDINYSPYSIKRALWNTATKLSHVDPFAQGNGLLNVEKAFENLVNYHDRKERDVRFNITVGTPHSKGIHIRRGILNRPEEFDVKIQPVFLKENHCPPRNKINFNLHITLIPSENWVQCGSFLDLCYSSRMLPVKIDPTGLPAGVHTAKIRAYEAGDIEKGTLFEIPITVVQPIELNSQSNWKLNLEPKVYKPNTITRNFILVPNNATWAVLRIRSKDIVKSFDARFFIHTMQILPQRYCRTLETQKMLTVSNENDTLHYFKVEHNTILEVCIAKYWSNFGDTTVEAAIEFHGIRPSSGSSMMHAASGIHRIDLIPLLSEDASPWIQLKTANMVLKPSEAKISPLTQRDIVPHGRQIYQNQLTFNLNLSKPQEVAFSVPLLTKVLYESEYESQFWMCFDSNKKMIASGDAYSGNNYTKLNKGEYIIRLQVRHEKKDLLEKINEAILLATFKLGNSIGLEIYPSYRAAILNEKKINTSNFGSGKITPIYVAPLSNEKISKAGHPNQCSFLQGTFSVPKDDRARKVDNHSFDYILPEGPAVPKKNNSNLKSTKSKLEEYKEGLRDFQNNQISKLELADAEELYADILRDFPSYLQAHISIIQKLELVEAKNSWPLECRSSLVKSNDLEAAKMKLKRILDLANTVINETNVEALLAYYGLKTDNRVDAAKIKIEMDKQKSTLLEAYVKKIVGLGKLGIIEIHQNKKDAQLPYTLDEINDIYTEVGKFSDCTDSKVILLALWHAYLNQHFGRMAKILQKMYEDKPTQDTLEELNRVIKENKWDHIDDLLRKIIVYSFPAGYRLF